MAKYKLRFKESVAKDLRRIPNSDVTRILKRIDVLAENPRGEGCVKLSGNDRYRVRTGQYRVVYEIADDSLVVSVVKVAHRSTAYKSH
ncbi:MAG: type II toxin-antitoxin system mRNA interferase toxin, RelE/StbE family [Acidiferrobacteraceae bacterium]|jgi:mRNA interferase RelE/StbE|nr:type II toxin-antitoxin system mRNA interferase toxin, RelE/StbE family [Acidiferrobacteraceae bacterium]|tara:strand:- start:208 stop:471 length:264 start_codon:yes stop_codon:yes gene_type:complete